MYPFFPLKVTYENSRLIDTYGYCRQYGTRESKEVTVEGRVQFDLLQVLFIDQFYLGYFLTWFMRNVFIEIK